MSQRLFDQGAASQFVNGKPIFGMTKTSEIRQQTIVKKEDRSEDRALRLELYRQRAESGLDIFSERGVA